MRHRRLLLAATVAALAASVLTASPTAAYPGAPWFRPGHPYSANFPDPSIVRDGATYVAFSTSTGGAYLPVMTSPDLATWTARPEYPQPACVGGAVDQYFNDAFPCPPAWGQNRAVGGRLVKEVWAPGATTIGGRWLVFYSMRVSTAPDRFCIGLAVSETGPLGPYLDGSAQPFQCDSDPVGSIDPQPFVDADGTPYLIWKSEGVVGSTPPRIWGRQLSADGLSFAPGSTQVELVRNTPGTWEGDVIETPSMVRAGGRVLLFFSGNEWQSTSYAIGYAECQSPLGPCTKSASPVHASGGDENGPGAPSAFLDASGALRVAYQWWNAPFSSYPADPGCDGADPLTGGPLCASQGQRRMRIANVSLLPGAIRWGGPPPAVARDTADACPPGQVPPAGFNDVPPGEVHRSNIDCMAWWGIAGGTGPGTYAPGEPVSRAQMASFLVRLINASGGTLVQGAPDAFPDDNGSPHEANIDVLAQAGVIGGRADGTFGPGASVTREQMATFLVRTYELRAERDLPTGIDRFPDDEGSVHEPNIDAAAEAGFTGGRPDGTYAPGGVVTRAQMASFLARVLDLLAEQADAP